MALYGHPYRLWHTHHTHTCTHTLYAQITHAHTRIVLMCLYVDHMHTCAHHIHAHPHMQTNTRTQHTPPPPPPPPPHIHRLWGPRRKIFNAIAKLKQDRGHEAANPAILNATPGLKKQFSTELDGEEDGRVSTPQVNNQAYQEVS